MRQTTSYAYVMRILLPTMPLRRYPNIQVGACRQRDQPLKIWINTMRNYLLGLKITHGLWNLCCIERLNSCNGPWTRRRWAMIMMTPCPIFASMIASSLRSSIVRKNQLFSIDLTLIQTNLDGLWRKYCHKSHASNCIAK